MPASHPSLAIVIVTFNSRTEIGGCLDSVVGHTQPLPTTITVVDNHSTDGTVQLIRNRWPGVQVIEPGDNLGFSRANNLGVRCSSSDYVLLLNPDTVARPGAIQTLVRALATESEAAIAGPRLVTANGLPELSWGPPIGPWGELCQKLLSALYERRVRPVVGYVERLSRQNRRTAWVSGACLLVRRTDLEAAGLFDERYFMYTEDVDLCVSMHKRGRFVLYVADAELQHFKGRSASKNPDTERLRRSSHVAYYEKHHPAWAPLLRLYLRLTGRPGG